VDSERFDQLARGFGERGAERDRDRDQFAALIRLVTINGTRRVVLAGLLGAGLQGLGRQPTAAQCRSKEGKDKRQCRRREREQNAPGAGTCIQDKLFGLCSLFRAEPCCNGMTCADTIAGPFVTACQYVCQTDADCKQKFPNKALACRPDALICLFQSQCCVPR
jgi:hypothetical protein